MNDHKFSKQSYEDMIHLPHPVSKNHPQMSLRDRAAQFSPFAALTGYDGAIKETARRTDQRIELDDMEKDLLDEKLGMIQEHSEVEIEFFKEDERKEGGEYQIINGIVEKINRYERKIILKNGMEILIDDISNLIVEF